MLSQTQRTVGYPPHRPLLRPAQKRCRMMVATAARTPKAKFETGKRQLYTGPQKTVMNVTGPLEDETEKQESYTFG